MRLSPLQGLEALPTEDTREHAYFGMPGCPRASRSSHLRRRIQRASRPRNCQGGGNLVSYGAGIQRGPMAADNFTQIANALFRDRRISFKAKGIFGLISTHRAGFTVTVAALVRSGTDGKSAVTTGLQELEKFGYLERGQWYRITDVPAHLFDLLGDDATGMLDRVQNRRSEPLDNFPSTDDPATGNRTTKKNNPKKTTQQKTKPRPSVPRRPPRTSRRQMDGRMSPPPRRSPGRLRPASQWPRPRACCC
ncbi:hypothetical protein ABZY81_18205 [Streptomyces sp. NPDC006514]|uniref:hypothetical protein n=1 Tax=Streptomyces sp. NPDC006514 TaxID=3154308 RepID=UPI0033BCB67F